MVTTIDSAGRLVIPSEIRREADLRPGVPLEVRFHDGRIEIEPQPLPIKLVRKGELVIAQPEKKTPKLTSETEDRVRRDIRSQRGR
ncbi:MAG TPA: AbrB/MazE/SpoVT family DNA-binding domain-containing protein [Terriglobales bacterium]|nr:AbrB/MazE/SpoVT family DNA-binding domain-containing protein [Terriglobales bacterium]